MLASPCRRSAIRAFASFPFALVLTACSKAPSGVQKASRVVVAIGKKIAKFGPIAIDWVELVVEIKAIIDGKEETIKAHITKEEGEVLRNGGQLVIKGADGAEVPVEYRSK